MKYGGFAAEKMGDGRLIFFFDIWALPKCQKKIKRPKEPFAAEGDCLATKKNTYVLLDDMQNVLRRSWRNDVLKGI